MFLLLTRDRIDKIVGKRDVKFRDSLHSTLAFSYLSERDVQITRL